MPAERNLALVDAAILAFEAAGHCLACTDGGAALRVRARDRGIAV